MPLKLVRRSKTGPWYVRGTVRRRRIFETTGTEKRELALLYKAKREAELYEASVLGKRAPVPFVSAAVSFLEFEERSPATEAYVNRLVGHFGDRAIGTINQAAADAAVAAILKPDAAPATKVRAVYAPLSAILNHAHRRGWCDAPKFQTPRLPKGKTRWITPTEALKLIEVAAPHLRPLITFVLCTGARMAEALELQWADVDLPAAKVVFRDTKNGTDRVAMLTPAAIVTLANIPYEEDEQGNKLPRRGPVFRRDDGEPYADRERLGGGQIKTAWRTACVRAGLADPVLDAEGKPVLDDKERPVMDPNATPHDLRHTWATWFYGITKDLLLLKSEGGWKTLSMVERYAHLMPSALVPEIAKVWGASHPRFGAILVHPKAEAV